MKTVDNDECKSKAFDSIDVVVIELYEIAKEYYSEDERDMSILLKEMKDEILAWHNSQVAGLLDELEKELVKGFISEFCNDHNGYVRFLRGIFFDEKDGAESIIKYINKKISEMREGE